MLSDEEVHMLCLPQVRPRRERGERGTYLETLMCMALPPRDTAAMPLPSLSASATQRTSSRPPFSPAGGREHPQQCYPGFCTPLNTPTSTRLCTGCEVLITTLSSS